jgi:hypothetical protein
MIQLIREGASRLSKQTQSGADGSSLPGFPPRYSLKAMRGLWKLLAGS